MTTEERMNVIEEEFAGTGLPSQACALLAQPALPIRSVAIVDARGHVRHELTGTEYTMGGLPPLTLTVTAASGLIAAATERIRVRYAPSPSNVTNNVSIGADGPVGVAVPAEAVQVGGPDAGGLLQPIRIDADGNVGTSGGYPHSSPGTGSPVEATLIAGVDGSGDLMPALTDADGNLSTSGGAAVAAAAPANVAVAGMEDEGNLARSLRTRDGRFQSQPVEAAEVQSYAVERILEAIGGTDFETTYPAYIPAGNSLLAPAVFDMSWATVAAALADFVTAGFQPGMRVTMSGWANPANNTTADVLSVTATTLSLKRWDGTAWVAGALTAGVRYVPVGTISELLLNSREVAQATGIDTGTAPVRALLVGAVEPVGGTIESAKVDPEGNVLTAPRPTTTAISGSVTAIVANTPATAMPTVAVLRRVTVRADPANPDVVWIGDASMAVNAGMPLEAGDSVTLFVDNVDAIYYATPATIGPYALHYVGS